MLTLMKMILKPLFMSNLDKNYDNRYKRCNGYKQCKSCTKDISKGLLPVVWNPTRWGDWCMPKDKKKEMKPILIDEK